MVAINHIPFAGDDIVWDQDTVRFTLPDELIGKPIRETIWVSLFVDGMETNALPFQVIQDMTTAVED